MDIPVVAKAALTVASPTLGAALSIPGVSQSLSEIAFPAIDKALMRALPEVGNLFHEVFGSSPAVTPVSAPTKSIASLGAAIGASPQFEKFATQAMDLLQGMTKEFSPQQLFQQAQIALTELQKMAPEEFSRSATVARMQDWAKKLA